VSRAPTACTVSGRDFRSPFVPVEWQDGADTFLPLRDYAASSPSGLNAIHYRIPLPSPAPPLGSAVPFPSASMLQWYALDSLDLPGPASQGPIVTAADFVSFQYLDPPRTWATRTILPDGTGVRHQNQHRAGFRKDERFGRHPVGPAPLVAEGTLEVHAAYRHPQGPPVGFEIAFPLLNYRGEAHDVEVGVDVELTLELFENVWSTPASTHTARSDYRARARPPAPGPGAPPARCASAAQGRSSSTAS
jgi:hypothetical protein